MNRRNFLERTSLIAAAGFTGSMTLVEKADALESVMIDELDRHVHTSWMCNIGEGNTPAHDATEAGGQSKRYPALMGDDPRLPKMPDKPKLMDFFNHRMKSPVGRSHMLQSAKLAMDKGLPEKIVLACLIHDISVTSLVRPDHGYWAAQLVEPYVDEEVSWAIRYHQALRFIPDESVGYEYPEAYIKFFGEDYEIPEYIARAARYAQNHKWYMSARQITINDLYSFDPDKMVEIDEFEDIIGRNFKQPKEGLGFDGSPVAHMWRTIIWPNNFL